MTASTHTTLSNAVSGMTVSISINISMQFVPNDPNSQYASAYFAKFWPQTITWNDVDHNL